MLRALLFDLDDTLLQTHATHTAAVRRSCEVAAAHHPDWSLPRLQAAFHAAHTELERRLERGQVIFPTQFLFRAHVWEHTLRACGLPADLGEHLAQVYLEERDREHRLFPDAVLWLNRFREEYTLVLVTNGLADFQRQKIERTDLASHLDHIVVSGELGSWKPDGGIFTHALSLAGTGPEHAVMIGDSLRHDIRGANEAGIRSVWMRRYHHLEPHPEITPTAIASDMEELAALLRAWNPPA